MAQALVIISLCFILLLLNLRQQLGQFSKFKKASSRDIKRHFFPINVHSIAMLMTMFLIKQIFEKKLSKTASKIQMQFCPRITTEQPEGSYKLGSLYPFLCLSISPSVHLSGHVLGTGSLVLSNFWHGFKVCVNKICTYYISEYHF